MTTPIALVGFMGAGKSTVGRLLAREVGFSFCDLDRAVESMAGMKVAAIFAELGEEHFRTLEAQALHDALRSDSVVVGTGGGTFAQPELRDLLRARAWTCFLDASLECCLQRAAHSRTRPLLDRGPREVRELYERRKPLYSLAHFRVDTEGGEPSDIATSIVLGYRSHIRT